MPSFRHQMQYTDKRLATIKRNRVSIGHHAYEAANQKRVLRALSQATCSTISASERGILLKERLKQTISPIKSCGIFGLKSAELQTIKGIVEELEAENPLRQPTAELRHLAGRWNVCFSTIKVTGSRRIKLGLRDLVHIGALTQEIDLAASIAVNRVGFNVPAFNIRNGELVLKAAYTVSSPTRVEIELEQATLVPQRLQNVFEANFDLLLSIFNPEGFLDITYCDQDLRCGRDDKGNLFILEREPETFPA